MPEVSTSTSVWHVVHAQSEYIVAAAGALAAAKAFERIGNDHAFVPQPYAEIEKNDVGRTLAIAHPGKVYRRAITLPA